MDKGINIKSFLDLADKYETYFEFRKEMFKKAGALEEDVRRWEELRYSRAELPCIIFNPKRVSPFRDRYYCCSNEVARRVMHVILLFPDVDWSELKYQWASVDFRIPHGESHVIPGQSVDGRERIRKV